MVAARKLQELQNTKASSNIVQEDTSPTRSDVVLQCLFAAKPWNLRACKRVPTETVVYSNVSLSLCIA